MAVRRLTREEIERIIWGATLLGAGGGGPPYVGLRMALQAMRAGPVKLADPSDVAGDSLSVVTFGMGSPVAHSEKWLDIQLVRAIDELERYLKKRFRYAVAFEQGGGNTAAAVYSAANKGLLLIDGDGVGRAVPELQMTTFDLYRVPISPAVLCDEDERTVIINVPDAYSCEALSRAIAVEYGFLAGVAAYVMDGKTLKRCIVPRTMSLAMSIGQAIADAKRSGGLVSEAIRKVTGGVVLMRGIIIGVESRTLKGFDFGVTEIQGVGEFGGKSLKISFKNENIIAWSGEKPVALAPDLICVVDEVSREPLTNADIKVGSVVSVLAIPAHQKVRKGRGAQMFRHLYPLLGYKGEFVPFELVG